MFVVDLAFRAFILLYLLVFVNRVSFPFLLSLPSTPTYALFILQQPPAMVAGFTH